MRPVHLIVIALVALGAWALWRLLAVRRFFRADGVRVWNERERRRFLATHNGAVARVPAHERILYRCDYVTAWGAGAAYGNTRDQAIDRARIAVLSIGAEDLRGVLSNEPRPFVVSENVVTSEATDGESLYREIDAAQRRSRIQHGGLA